MSERQQLRQLLLESVTFAGGNHYDVSFIDRATGATVDTRFTLERSAESVHVRGVEPDVFGAWMGDAESVRSVNAAVAAVDRARQLSMREYES